MSSTLNIPAPQTDPINAYTHRNSFSSSGSSPMSSPNSNNWYTSDAVDDPYRQPTKQGVSTFIRKLFSMVSDRRNQPLISWNPSGSSFLVCNAALFAKEVLPAHFKHSKFSSFVRQLNMYGFHKINKSPRGQRGHNKNEIWEFSHPRFQRGRPDMFESIKRKAMDSELLRRETGDIHASFAMVQLSQSDVLHQFRVLQENFAKLSQGFEDMKKVQLQQQLIINKLLECQESSHSNISSMTPFTSQSNLTAIDPSSAVHECPQQAWHPHQQPFSQEMMMSSMYRKQSHQRFPLSRNGQNTLPPSPDPSILLPSPLLSYGKGTINTLDNPGQRMSVQGINFSHSSK